MNNNMENQPVKLALPKGRFLSPTANLLGEINLGFAGYSSKTRRYRLQSARFPYLSAKIFQEKDVPIQVAVGNYDLGICGSDWIEEVVVKYPAGALVKMAGLNYGEGSIYVVASTQAGFSNLDELLARQNDWRIVSEYPNLAEAFALKNRVRRFRIFPVWGAAEVYPPESADLAILQGKNESDLKAQGVLPLMRLFKVTAFLIANRESLGSKNLSQILTCLSNVSSSQSNITVRQDNFIAVSQSPEPFASCYFERNEESRGAQDKLREGEAKQSPSKREVTAQLAWQSKEIKLALPDGHQSPPTSQFLKRTGLSPLGYSGKALNRRPSINLDWVGIKVIRPQDMPLQVANGNFDLAVTGEDWLLEHLYRFPSSPVAKLLDLGFGRVKIVAAVSRDMPVANIAELRSLVQSGEFAPFRVASEYINIADKYLRDNYISPYKLIPTWGASEAFLPEDADLLIDNTQTGRTLAQHGLKVIDVLFQSTACLIGNKDSLDSRGKKEKIESLIRIFQSGLL